MANANGHEIGCTCEACYLAAAPLPKSRELEPGISASEGPIGAPCFLLVHCGGFISEKKIRCKATLEVPLPIDELAELLLDAGWVGSERADAALGGVREDHPGRCARGGCVSDSPAEAGESVKEPMQLEEQDTSAAVVRLTKQLDNVIEDEDIGDVMLATGIVAARRARRAGGTLEDFLEDMRKSWKASIQR